MTYSSSEKMVEGQIITYRIRIAPLIHGPWVTEIKSVKEPQSFIDNQSSSITKSADLALSGIICTTLKKRLQVY